MSSEDGDTDEGGVKARPEGAVGSAGAVGEVVTVDWVGSVVTEVVPGIVAFPCGRPPFVVSEFVAPVLVV